VTRPNTLVITTDQHRWDWLGCAGTPGVETPNIDALAARGVWFTQHVTNTTVCAPARIGLASGIAPVRLGAFTNQDILAPETPTYYQALRDAGDRVGCVGKLDLNKPEQDNGALGTRPDTYRWGFTDPVEAEGKMHAGMTPPGHPYGPYGVWLQEQGLFETLRADYALRMEEIVAKYLREPGDPPSAGTRWFDDSALPTHAFEDLWIGRRSCEWLRTVPDGSPWHLYVSFVGPHDPFDPPTEYADHFRGAPVPAPILDDGTGRNPATRAKEYGNTEDELIAARRQYTAALAAIDDAVGDIISTLDDVGAADDTVVIFSADHGEMLGDHHLFQKSVPYEPAMRIPLIVAGPGIEHGRCDALTELVDVSATVLDVAAVDPLAPIDGRSLLSCVDNPASSHRDAQVVTQSHYRSIRTATHKFVHYVDSRFDHDELFDLAADPDETQNLIDDEPTIRTELEADLTARLGEEEMAARA
jgi:choline-sulfatase